MAKKKQSKKVDFKLIVGDENQEHPNADIPVRWCISPSLIKRMQKNGVVNPYVLITATDNRGGEIKRQLVPITEQMTFVQFVKAGEVRIHAWIVDGSVGRKKLNKNLIRVIGTNRNRYAYAMDLIDYDYEMYESVKIYDNVELVQAHTEIPVIIPENAFGKKPPQWVTWFVNLWHESGPQDQCQFRRRFIFAITIKWLPVLIGAVSIILAQIFLAVFVAASGFYKSIDKPKKIFQPFGSDMSDAYSYSPGPNSFLVDYNTEYGKTKQKVTLFSMLTFIPTIPLIIFGSMWLASSSWSVAVLTTIILEIGIFVSLATIDAINIFNNYAKNSPSASQLAKQINQKMNIKSLKDGIIDSIMWIFVVVIAVLAMSLAAMVYPNDPTAISIALGLSFVAFLLVAILNKYESGPVQIDYSSVGELACSDNMQADYVTYTAIPKKNRSFRLWYLNMKNKICKPMQM